MGWQALVGEEGIVPDMFIGQSGSITRDEREGRAQEVVSSPRIRPRELTFVVPSPRPLVRADTMGYAFTFPIVKLVAGWNVPIGAYIHYPTIRSVTTLGLAASWPTELTTAPSHTFANSTDMLSRVQNRQGTHTNTAVAKSALRSFIKLQYVQPTTALICTSPAQHTTNR